MKLHDYKILIRNLPVRQLSGRTKRETWEKFETYRPWLRKLNDQIFEGQPEVLLSRQDVFNEKTDIQKLIIKTILWGYLKGMRGNHFASILSKFNNLESILTELQKNKKLDEKEFTKIKSQFDKIPGLGLSTYSKLLYFLEIEIDDYPCIILDFRIIDTLQRNNLDDFISLKSITRQNGAKHYINFLKTSSNLAKKLKTKSENIEQFVFSFGGNLKE